MLLTMKRLNHLVGGILSAVLCLLLAVPAAVAVSAQDFPLSLPDDVVVVKDDKQKHFCQLGEAGCLYFPFLL